MKKQAQIEQKFARGGQPFLSRLSFKQRLKKAIDRGGFGLTSIIIGIVALAAIMIPTTKWFISMSSGASDLGDKLEMQSFLQDYWNNINAMTYDEFNAAIASKGMTWTEELGGKWKITVKFSNDGKYANAKCNVGTAAGATDRHCRKAEISIVSKTDSKLAQGVETVKVSMSAESSTLNDLKTRMAAAENKFGSYYTKDQVNSTLSSYAKTSALSSYATTSALNTALGNYYTKAQVNSTLGSYATTAALGNYATTSAMNTKFGSYYTKSEVDDKMSGIGGTLSFNVPSRLDVAEADWCGNWNMRWTERQGNRLPTNSIWSSYMGISAKATNGKIYDLYYSGGECSDVSGGG